MGLPSLPILIVAVITLIPGREALVLRGAGAVRREQAVR